ncbi:MAG TPA: DJ-1/PfpI family protein [Nocardioidaceae bacterium]|nr:DJ-1/PfpI family protein [Nocardioidaceae bacterium]
MSSPSALPGTPKRVLLLVYDTFAEFEVSVLITALTGTTHTLTTFGLTGGAVTSTGGLRVVPDMAIAEVDPGEFDALVVPGGEASRLLGRPELQRLVTALDRRGALLAAICGGPAVLGDAGVLDGRSFTAALAPKDRAWPGVAGRGNRLSEMVVVDGNVVTATGSSYLSFAEEVLRCLDERSDVEPLTFFREPSLG